MPLQIELLIVYLFLSAFFSASETAFTSLSISDINLIKKRGTNKARLISKFYDRPNDFLTTVLICNNLVNVLISVSSTALAIKISSSYILGITTAIVTIILLIFGEIIPKQIAIINNIFIISNVIYVINIFSIILKPLVMVFDIFSKIILAMSSNKDKGASVESILQMVNYAKNLGIIDRYKSQIINSVFQLENIPIKNVMVRRKHMFLCNKNVLISDSLQYFLKNKLTEFTIYKENKENIKGVVSLIDVLQAIKDGHGDKNLSYLSKDPTFIPQSMSLQEFMKIYKDNDNMIIVLDEYGGLDGYIKKENIAKIFDFNIIEQNIKDWVHINCNMPLFKFEEYFSLELDEKDKEDTSTLSGYIIKHFGGVPPVNFTVITSEGAFFIKSVSSGRIKTASFKKTEEKK